MSCVKTVCMNISTFVWFHSQVGVSGGSTDDRNISWIVSVCWCSLPYVISELQIFCGSAHDVYSFSRLHSGSALSSRMVLLTVIWCSTMAGLNETKPHFQKADLIFPFLNIARRINSILVRKVCLSNLLISWYTADLQLLHANAFTVEKRRHLKTKENTLNAKKDVKK